MNFGEALEALKAGKKVARKGWNGKGMWIAMMSGMKLPAFETLPYIAMWTADSKWLPGWLASQTDMLAEDWQIVD